MPAHSRHPATKRSLPPNAKFASTPNPFEPNKKAGETHERVLSLYVSTFPAEGLRALQWRVKPRGALAKV